MSRSPTEAVAAATVVVLRDSPTGPQVLMVRRRQSGDFAGASVFPGGLVDPGDAAADLAPPESGFSAVKALARMGEDLPPERAQALHVAACRELFEEAGLLFARERQQQDLVAGPPAALRPALLRAGAVFSDLLREHSLVLALDHLQPLARWITPEHQPRRWDTRFFLAAAPGLQPASSDGDETSEALWLQPLEALDAYRSGEHLLAPPTFRVLEELMPFRSVGEALAAAAAAPPPVCILPVPLAGAAMPTLVYPGDRDYPGSRTRGLNRLLLVDGRWRSERD